MKTLQILKAGVVVGVAAFPDDATITPGGASATWEGGGFAAPEGEILMDQPGAAIGWALSGGVLVPPSSAAPTMPQLRAHANAKAEALRAAARAYTLTHGLVVQCDATQGTGVDLIGLLNWGTANNAATTNFVQNDGGVVTLTGEQCVALANAVLAYGQSVFAILAQAMNGISNGAITTTAQIDALSWPA